MHHRRTRPRSAAPIAGAVRATAAIAFALLAGTGCVRRAPPPDLSPDPAALLAQVEAARGRVDRVRGEARVRVEAREGSGTVTQFVVAERPGRLRLEALDFFGNLAAVLVVDGDRLALLDLRHATLLRGAATAANVARLVPLPIPPTELVQLLCGEVPLIEGRPAAAEPGDGVMRLTLEGTDRVQRLDVGAGGVVVASAVTARRGAPAQAALYDVALDRFRDAGGVRFPYEVRLESAGARVRLRLVWKEIEIGGVPPEASFTLEPPPGVRVVDLDEAR